MPERPQATESTPALERRAVLIGGVERAYLLCGTMAPAGIVLSLHGSRSTAARQAAFSGMSSLQANGMVVVFPQAALPAGRGYAWEHGTDLGYLAAVLEDVRARLGSPGAPVFLSGMSGGARMACHYAAARADEVAAVAAVAGLRTPDSAPARPVPVVAFHGRADRINPYLGGRGDRWRESVPEAAEAWAIANGAGRDAAVTEVSPRLTKVSYGAGTPTEVTLWTFADAGHTWPGHPAGPLFRLLLGRTSTELDATQEIARFFSRTQPIGSESG